MFLHGINVSHWITVNVLAQYQCSCTVSMFCTGTVFNNLENHQSFALEQFSVFLHSIKVLHLISFQCCCTVSMFTRTVFFLIFPKCSVLVSLEQCTNGTGFQCLFKIHECMALMFSIGTVFNCYVSTLR